MTILRGSANHLLFVISGLFVLPFIFVQPAESRTPSDSRYFAALGASKHLRDGYIEFDDRRTEHVAPASLLSFGFSAGKNVKLPGPFRLSLPLFFEYGSAVEDTITDITLEDGTTPEIYLYTTLYSGGVQPQVQAPLRLTENSWAFATLGGGVYYTVVAESEKTNDKRHIRVLDNFLEKSAGITFAALGGLGLEWTVNPYASVYLLYQFKYWQPVQRKIARDLFPITAMPYHEQFLTHSITLGYMFSRRH